MSISNVRPFLIIINIFFRKWKFFWVIKIQFFYSFSHPRRLLVLRRTISVALTHLFAPRWPQPLWCYHLEGKSSTMMFSTVTAHKPLSKISFMFIIINHNNIFIFFLLFSGLINSKKISTSKKINNFLKDLGKNWKLFFDKI